MNDQTDQPVAKGHRPWPVRIVLVLYAICVVTLILLAVSNYPIQWRGQVNRERQRYLQVIAQALRYYTLDHGTALPALPSQPVAIANTDACSMYCAALSKELPCYDLAHVLVPGYMKEMLQDPLSESNAITGFYIDATNKQVTLGACSTFLNQDVNVTESF